MSHIIEKDWVTSAGLRAVVLFVRDSHRCGYVGVNSGSSLFGVSYNNLYENGVDIDVHGGLTYSDTDKCYPVPSELHWFGFDCGHSGDKTKYWGDGEERTLEYCIIQCERMAEQLKSAKYQTKEMRIAELEQQRDDVIKHAKDSCHELECEIESLKAERDDLQALCRELVAALEDIARGHLQEPSFERHAVASAKLALNKARGKL